MKTKTIQFGEHNAELKEYITQKDDRDIRKPLYDNVNVNDAGEMSGLKGSMAFQMEDKCIEVIVVSLDGSGENILQRALELPAKDYQALMKEVNNVFNGIDDEKKNP